MHICKLSRRKIARECIFSAEVPAYARIRAGAAALKSNCASNIFLRESNCLNALHCLAVPSEGTRPQGRGVPKYEKITVSFSRHVGLMP